MKYTEYGMEHQDTMILLHGGGLAPWNFREEAQQLRDQYHVILPVLDGHSGSDRDFTTIQSNADEIIGFIKENMIAFLQENAHYQLKNDIEACQAKALILVGRKETGVMKKSAEMLHLPDSNDGNGEKPFRRQHHMVCSPLFAHFPCFLNPNSLYFKAYGGVPFIPSQHRFQTTLERMVSPMKKLLACLLCLALLLVSGATAVVAEGTQPLIAQVFPLYFTSVENSDEVTLYFRNEQMDIPYIDMDTALELLLHVQELYGDKNYQLTRTVDGSTVIWTRENGSRMELDFAEGVIGWDDYNVFITPSFSQSILDVLVHPGVNEAGEPELFQRVPAFSRHSGSMGLRFSDFFINLVYEDGQGYLPLQTFSDLFVAYTYMNFAFNGQAVFLINANSLGDMEELYYAVAPRPRSAELARFNYAEVCLSLQFNYGLKDAHNIPSFGSLFAMTGMEERLLSPDALEADVALYDVVNGYIDDLHTGFTYASPYAGKVAVTPTVASTSQARLMQNYMRFYLAAKPFFPTGLVPYQEVGNTAYVTFMKFRCDYSIDYYGTLGSDAYLDDTIALIMYAHSQITRENSPIENVVLDLSLNTGGNADAAIYTIAWFLGQCNLYLEDAITGAQSSLTYNIDVNGDRVFDDRDSVASLNRYCIISPVSFSCGNLVPAALRSSNQVTLLGRHSGGGACAIQPLVTADGTVWQISSRLRLSTIFNGSFYDIDQGVEPNIYIDKLENIYNRERLTDYLNSLI